MARHWKADRELAPQLLKYLDDDAFEPSGILLESERYVLLISEEDIYERGRVGVWYDKDTDSLSYLILRVFSPNPLRQRTPTER